jgi:hypothetical protein
VASNTYHAVKNSALCTIGVGSVLTPLNRPLQQECLLYALRHITGTLCSCCESVSRVPANHAYDLESCTPLSRWGQVDRVAQNGKFRGDRVDRKGRVNHVKRSQGGVMNMRIEEGFHPNTYHFYACKVGVVCSVRKAKCLWAHGELSHPIVRRSTQGCPVLQGIGRCWTPTVAVKPDLCVYTCFVSVCAAGGLMRFDGRNVGPRREDRLVETANAVGNQDRERLGSPFMGSYSRSLHVIGPMLDESGRSSCGCVTTARLIVDATLFDREKPNLGAGVCTGQDVSLDVGGVLRMMAQGSRGRARHSSLNKTDRCQGTGCLSREGLVLRKKDHVGKKRLHESSVPLTCNPCVISGGGSQNVGNNILCRTSLPCKTKVGGDTTPRCDAAGIHSVGHQQNGQSCASCGGSQDRMEPYGGSQSSPSYGRSSNPFGTLQGQTTEATVVDICCVASITGHDCASSRSEESQPCVCKVWAFDRRRSDNRKTTFRALLSGVLTRAEARCVEHACSAATSLSGWGQEAHAASCGRDTGVDSLQLGSHGVTVRPYGGACVSPNVVNLLVMRHAGKQRALPNTHNGVRRSFRRGLGRTSQVVIQGLSAAVRH